MFTTNTSIPIFCRFDTIFDFFNRSIVCTVLRYNETPSFISTMPNPALAAKRRTHVVCVLLMFISVWMNLRPNLFATAAVTTLPPKKSATTIPSLLLALMMRSRRASGFWVAWTNSLPVLDGSISFQILCPCAMYSYSLR